MTLPICVSPGEKILADVLADYQSSRVTPVTVRNWSRRFNLGKVQREQFVEALAHMYGPGGAFVSRDQLVAFAQSNAEKVLRGRAQGYDVICFGREMGKSTRFIAQVMDEYAQERQGEPLVWASQEGVFFGPESIGFFVDDGYYTGFTFLRACLEAHAKGIPIYANFYTKYTFNAAFNKKRCRDSGLDIQGIGGQQNHPTRVLRPLASADLLANPDVQEFCRMIYPYKLSWRRICYQNDKDVLFRNQADRSLVESQLFLEGVRMHITGLSDRSPMGHFPFLNMGAGASTVALNSPNTGPLAIHLPREDYPALLQRVSSGGIVT